MPVGVLGEKSNRAQSVESYLERWSLGTHVKGGEMRHDLKPTAFNLG